VTEEVVLDLFAGLGGWSEPARELGLDVVRVDNDPRFDVELTADLFKLTAADVLEATGDRRPFLVLASPPCESFSVLTIGRNWNLDNTPKTSSAAIALELVYATRRLIEDLAPAFYVIENPVAKLRALPVLRDVERRSVTYCRLGESFKKPTDLWGGFPPSLELPAPCSGDPQKYGTVEIGGRLWVRDTAGRPCHLSAPRGSRTGIQGGDDPRMFEEARNAGREALPSFAGGMLEGMRQHSSGSSKRREVTALRAKIPYRLAELVTEAALKDHAAGNRYVETTLF
jgi:hypothetical protein